MLKTLPLKARSPKRKMSRLFAEHGGRMVVHWTPSVSMSDEQLLRFCQENEGLQVEQNSEGESIIMPPVGTEGSSQSFNLYGFFWVWQQSVGGGGKCFDCSAGFRLPNGALRSPDVSWVRQVQLDKLSKEEWREFPRLCPDFVLELCSRTDRLPTLQTKMSEYMDNGARLGWLIDPLEKQVFIYRPGQPGEHLQAPAILSGDPVLVGFTLDLARVW